MKKRPTDKEILATLSNIIVEALLVDPVKIRMETRIFLDLGAESIDIVDIRFRMEHAYGFKINQDEMIRSLGEDLSRDQVEESLTVRSLVEYIGTRLEQQGEVL
jgi:acyl carrier protein